MNRLINCLVSLNENGKSLPKQIRQELNNPNELLKLRISDLRIDSLELYELVMLIEDHMDIRLAEEKVLSSKTMADISDTLDAAFKP
jgi:acyl carrier protein